MIPDVNELFKEQKECAKRAILTDTFGPIKRIGGVDCSYFGDDYIIAGLVVLEFDTLLPVYRTFEVKKLTFPYIPGLLAYREADAMMSALVNSKVKPDVAMIDGFGTNHPRRCGLATHIGVGLDLPTIGIGKSFLCGRIDGEDIYQDGEKVGRLAYAKNAKLPVYISPGHKISLVTAVTITKACMRRGRIPEPVRLAHEYVTHLRSSIRP